MPRNAKYDRYVKPVRAKGRLYLYFDTGKKDERGKPVYARLPDLSDKRSYGVTYAAFLAARRRRETEGEQSHDLTVPELWALFQKSPKWRELKAGTQRVYFIYLERFAKLMPTAPASEVTTSDLMRLIDNMGETPGAANLFAGAVGSLYKWARGRHVPRECRPTFEIDFFRLGEHDPWPEPVLEAALASDDADVRLAVHLLYYTAQRLGDVLAMRWSDLSADAVDVVQQKTGKQLHIPLHDALKAELARTPRNGLAILSKPGGKRWSEGWTRDKLQRFAREHGAEVVPHGLRKNAVNALLEVGCSAAETAAISGQTLQMVEHYAKKRSQPKLASAAILRWNKR